MSSSVNDAQLSLTLYKSSFSPGLISYIEPVSYFEPVRISPERILSRDPRGRITLHALANLAGTEQLAEKQRGHRSDRRRRTKERGFGRAQ